MVRFSNLFAPSGGKARLCGMQHCCNRAVAGVEVGVGRGGGGVWEQDQHLKQLPAQACDLEAKIPAPSPILH